MDVYQEVTDRIVSELEQGNVPWRKPWRADVGQPRSIDGRPYRGINALLLGLSGYEDPRWGTYRAISKHGGQVRRGERSTMVVLWKPYDRTNRETGEREHALMLRYFNVFNVAQADWSTPLPALGKLSPLPADEIRDTAETIFSNYNAGPAISYGGDGAWYRMSEDRINLPVPDSFESTAGYAATLFHESVHSTGHPSRLNRPEVGHSAFGSEPYSREELVAEMGAAMLSASVGIEPDYPNSAAYVQSWLRALRNDKRLIVSAAARAQKAVDHILGTAPKAPESE